MEALPPQGKRRERRDRAVTFILALAGIGLSFVGILWAALCWFICLLFLADWIGSTERAAAWSTWKRQMIQVSTIFVLTILGSLPVYSKWKKEKAAVLEGEIHAQNPQVLEQPAVQLGNLDDIGIIQWEPDSSVKLLRDAEISFGMGADGIEISTTVRDR